jgi:integrase
MVNRRNESRGHLDPLRSQQEQVSPGSRGRSARTTPWRTSRRRRIEMFSLLWLALKTGAQGDGTTQSSQGRTLNPYDRTLFIQRHQRDPTTANYHWRHGSLSAFESTRKIPAVMCQKVLGLKAKTSFRSAIIDFRQVWDLYRPCAKKFHALRHTFAIRLYRKTKDLSACAGRARTS